MTLVGAIVGIIHPEALQKMKYSKHGGNNENTGPKYSYTPTPSPSPTLLSHNNKFRRKRKKSHMCVIQRVPREPPSRASSQDNHNESEGLAFTPWDLNFVTNKWSKLANHTQLTTPHKKRQGYNTRGEVTTRDNPPQFISPNPQQLPTSETETQQTTRTSPPYICHHLNRNTSTNASKNTSIGGSEDGKKTHSTPCAKLRLQPNKKQHRRNS